MKLIEKPWAESKEKIVESLSVNPEHGLSETKADRRLEEFGPNELEGEEEVSFLRVLAHEIVEPMILLLFAVGILYSIFGELADGITIFVIIFILVFVEIYNEYRAKKTIQSLKELASPTFPVIRNGNYIEIDPKELVPGDIMQLKVGQKVQADGRLLEAYGLQVNESTLTGESVPISKQAEKDLEEDIELMERSNMVFAGTTITRGKAKAVVTQTGMDTQLGKIAGLTKGIEETKTPLQKSMRQLSFWLVFVALFFAVIIPLIGILQGQDLVQMILTGLSLSFATIPEELPIIITVVLALGAYTLTKQDALVKYLKTAETLGSVTVIATDKTGTLTKNQMVLSEIYADDQENELKGNSLTENQKYILQIGSLLSDVISDDQGNLKGDPLEIALVRGAEDNGINMSEIKGNYQLKNEFSFSNERRMMSQIYEKGDKTILFTKGATEKVLDLSSKIKIDQQEKELSTSEKEKIKEKLDDMAEKGLRVLSLAYREVAEPNLTEEEAEKDLVFLGMVGLEDPIREEVKDAIEVCKSAGIHVLLVTGDYEKTAKAVAEQLNIDARKIILGKEIDEMSPKDLQGRVKYIEVFARTTPEQKLKIVEALKANGEQVAVTGDGINDAPALKKADIGIAMGQTGTDVAREASDMVLLDDNFATITLSVKEGRKLYDNLKKGVRYYLAVKLALIVIFLLPVLFNIQLPFAPIQIILLELFMDLAASATFVIEPSESDVMKRSPRDPEEKFMDFRMNLWILLGALSLISAVLLIYFGFYGLGPDVARTMAFGTWMVSHVFLALNFRTEEDPLYDVGILSNKMTIIWGLGAIASMFVIMYVPALQTVFRVISLNFLQWLIIFGVAFVTSFWIEGLKILIKKKFS